jgi:hypothetical protein
MTKARTVSAKRRARKRREITLPGGEVATAPARQGMREPAADPAKTALEARKRVFMIDTCPKDDRAILAPLWATQAMCCISALAKPQAMREIRETWDAISAAHLNWQQRNTGITANPQAANIAMIPDRMETDQSLRVDLRSPEERDAAAIRAWDFWWVKIKALPTPQHFGAIRDALYGPIDSIAAPFWKDGQPTNRGRAFVGALVILAGHK